MGIVKQKYGNILQNIEHSHMAHQLVDIQRQELTSPTGHLLMIGYSCQLKIVKRSLIGRPFIV
jgi:hypothetical protein